LINYDSANYYFEKALSVIELSDVSRAERQTMANSKADVLTELGNVAMSQNQLQKALAYYQEALSLAESYGYHFGHMQTMLSLGQLYAQMGQAAQSLYYLERYSEEASSSGITLMEYAVKKSLILDYARLGRYDEMKKELDNLDEQRLSLTRENADVLDQIRELNDEVFDLVKRHESQNEQIETLKAQRNQYRLAFFGLLAIALFTVVLFVAYKIVSKKRAKIEKG
jgi:tetratricopeptide (TPR) repeat protein